MDEREQVYESVVALNRLIADDKVVYVSHDIRDFTKEATSLSVHGRKGIATVPITKNAVHETAQHIGFNVFGQERLVVGWAIKQLFSYLRFHLEDNRWFPPQAAVFDLQAAEAFTGYRDGTQPQSLAGAITRVRELASDKQLSVIRKRIHQPLATEVLPEVETRGVLDFSSRMLRYASYEVEGATNGRLSAHCPSGRYFNPHGMTDDEKKNFLPGEYKKFVVLDYKSMEVSVLHWLSRDARLGELLSSAQDFYGSLYQVLSGRPCRRPEEREFAKSVFLPVVFGQQAASFAEQHGISERAAQMLIDRVYSQFPVALAWADTQAEDARKGELKDYFGRRRNFGGKPWKARNAMVQGPAAVICLDKLVSLHRKCPEDCEVVASVHDGYVVRVPDKKVAESAAALRDVLLEPCDDFYPGLVLRLDAKSGKNLLDLESLGDA